MFTKGFEKTAGPLMDAFAKSTLNAFGGADAPKPPTPTPAPTNVGNMTGAKTMSQRTGNPFG